VIKNQRILVVDDDPQICSLLRDYLEPYGYLVLAAHNGREMRRRLDEKTFDLIILDIMLPGEDGITLCREIRQTSDVSIIILSAVGEESDRVIGLEVGADDYLAKPFSPRELLARIKALMRRSTGALGESRRKSQIASMPDLYFANLILDRKKRVLITEDQITLALSHGEYLLLEAFLENPQRVLSRDQLLDITRGRVAEAFDRSVDVQVARLRKKIEKDPKKPLLIITVRGGGYQFTGTVEQHREE